MAARIATILGSRDNFKRVFIGLFPYRNLGCWRFVFLDDPSSYKKVGNAENAVLFTL